MHAPAEQTVIVIGGGNRLCNDMEVGNVSATLGTY